MTTQLALRPSYWASVSGGKDSLVMLKALSDFKKFNLFNFEIVAINIDIYNGNEDYSSV